MYRHKTLVRREYGKASVASRVGWWRVIAVLLVMGSTAIGFVHLYSDPRPMIQQQIVFFALLTLIFFETVQAGWYMRRQSNKPIAPGSLKYKLGVYFGWMLFAAGLLLILSVLFLSEMHGVVLIAGFIAAVFGLIIATFADKDRGD